MKLVCSGLDLSDAVLKVVKAVGVRTTSPILEGIKLTAKGDCLTLTATDLELTIEKKIKAEIKQEGVAVVPGKYFSDFVRKINDDEIELYLNENKQIKITYKDSEGFLQCMNEDEYPESYKMEGCEEFTMRQNDFKELIKKTIFSVSSDDARQVLKGILFEIKEETVTAVALDGYRMAVSKKKVERVSADMSIVVPARSLSEIAKILSENEDDSISVKVHKNYLMVDKGDTKIITRLFEGDFINYKQIIPTTFETEILISKEKFENGLERAAVMSRQEKNNLVKFDIKEKILLLTSNSDIGNIKEKITIGMTGRDIAIAFNSKYYMDCLRVIEDDIIRVSFNSATSPCVVTPCDGNDYLFLILPVKMN